MAFGSRDQVFQQVARASGRQVPSASAPAVGAAQAAPLKDRLTQGVRRSTTQQPGLETHAAVAAGHDEGGSI
jgi:hypothetical protein